MRIAVDAPADEVRAELTRAFQAEGWEPPSPGKPAQVHLVVREHARGAVIEEVWVSKLGWTESVGARFAEAIVARGGWLLFVSPGIESSDITEWSAEGRETTTVGNPVSGGRSVEEKESRAARVHVTALAGDRIGPPKRGKSHRLEWRLANRAPVDEVLAALARGAAVQEMSVQGKPAFRVPMEGGTRILVLTPEEAARVREALVAKED